MWFRLAAGKGRMGGFLSDLLHAFGENHECTDYTNIFTVIFLHKINMF